MPEEWVGSMVEASNPGMEPIARRTGCGGDRDGPRFLRDIIDDDREFTWAPAPAGLAPQLPA